MRLLIDGYNLLFQSQLVGRARGPSWLERARQRLLGFLHRHLSQDVLGRTTIVFDASHTGDFRSDARSSHGISILFASEHPEADDLLEELIRRHPTPKSLTVVSSDHRVQRAANARRAHSMDSETFLSALASDRFELPNFQLPDAPDRPIREELTDEQVNYWLREFGEEQ